MVMRLDEAKYGGPRDRNALEEFATWDWLITPGGSTLHALRAFDDPAEANALWGGWGRTACGRHDVWLMIPGYGDRMAMPRCLQCCRAKGWPPGKGSPKNDQALRPLVEAELGRPLDVWEEAAGILPDHSERPEDRIRRLRDEGRLRDMTDETTDETPIDENWFESHDNRVLTASYMVDVGATTEELLHFIEKPWDYGDEYRLALERDAETA